MAVGEDRDGDEREKNEKKLKIRKIWTTLTHEQMSLSCQLTLEISTWNINEEKLLLFYM